MQYIKKTALCCAIATMALGAHAATIRLDAGIPHADPGGLDDDIVYDVGGLVVDGNGNIVVTGVNYVAGTLPGYSGAITCGAGTTAIDTTGDTNYDSCVPNLALVCGEGTAINDAGDGCEGTAPPDELAPTVSVTTSPDQLKDGQAKALVYFTFSEPVQGFAASDVSVTGGSIGGVTIIDTDNNVWRTVFTRDGNTAGTAVISVAANSYEDMSNNPGSSGSGSISLLDGSTTTPVEPPPVEPPEGCSATPAGVSVASKPLFDWSVNSNQTNLDLSRNGIHSYPIETTSNPAFNGRLSVLAFSNTQFVNKDVWFSECPGVEDLSEPLCKQEASNEFTMYWEQNTASKRCSLETNSTYYINVQNVNDTCSVSTGCDAKLQHLVIGSPD